MWGVNIIQTEDASPVPVAHGSVGRERIWH